MELLGILQADPTRRVRLDLITFRDFLAIVLTLDLSSASQLCKRTLPAPIIISAEAQPQPLQSPPKTPTTPTSPLISTSTSNTSPVSIFNLPPPPPPPNFALPESSQEPPIPIKPVVPQQQSPEIKVDSPANTPAPIEVLQAIQIVKEKLKTVERFLGSDTPNRRVVKNTVDSCRSLLESSRETLQVCYCRVLSIYISETPRR